MIEHLINFVAEHPGVTAVIAVGAYSGALTFLILFVKSATEKGNRHD